mgnify:FL=1
MKIVCLDAGHSDVKPGAYNKHLDIREEKLALELSLTVEELLKKQGIKVVQTRTNGNHISLEERCRRERNSNADCFISIHFNSGSPTASRCEAWVHNKSISKTINFAKEMTRNVSKALGNNDGSARLGYVGNPNVNYYVNEYSKSTSMLLEVCFISNDKEIKNYLNKRKEVAEQIAVTICNFLGVNYVKTEKVQAFDLVFENLNPNNYKFLMEQKLATGETLEQFIIRQQYRVKKVER